MVINGAKMIENSDFDLEDLQQFSLFLFDWIYNNMLLPGRVETWMILMDLNGVGITNIPMKKLKAFIAVV